MFNIQKKFPWMIIEHCLLDIEYFRFANDQVSHFMAASIFKE
jgi:hypothetical protein